MLNFLLLIIAIVLFVIVVPCASIYTWFYYQFKEKENRKRYYYRIAYTIDVLANVMGGEVFEKVLCKQRKSDTLFCKPNYSISEAVGKEIFESNFDYKHEWFLNILNKAFNEKNHCLEAYLNRIY
jgi:hypothetical protein